ncbi:hypothetical protein Q1695_011954 [Nippostrongylus brasiliensis]|nr:hypothetical protein Q1695_011954 [Nippostrongylus brasiliensis]
MSFEVRSWDVLLRRPLLKALDLSIRTITLIKELHAHLNGSISLKTLEKLDALKRNNSLHSEGSLESLQNLSLQQPTTMDEVFKIFPLIQSLTTTRGALITATLDVVKEFADDGVIYLELRSTPKSTTEMTKQEYVEALIEAILQSNNDGNIVTRLLLSIDRRQPVEDAVKTVDIATLDRSGMIVGVELSGDPSVDGRKFIPALQKARDAGFKVSVHLAEVDDQLEEVDEFLEFRPDRIGHGTFLHTEERFVDKVIKDRIPLEICLTSNVMSMTTRTIADSHLKFWRERSVPFSICTDDKGLMDCDLSREFHEASIAFDLTLDDLNDISKNALEMSFLDKSDTVFMKLHGLLKPR